jgi:hypothetical protein
MKKVMTIMIWDLILRYFLIGMSILVIPLFYIVLKPLTISFLSFLLSLFYNVRVQGNFLFFSSFSNSIEIIDACVAGSAFFLLLILNLSTREIGILKRIGLFIFEASLLFLFNISRLLVIIPLYLNGSTLFPIIHQVFWYGLSILFVILIWLFGALVFRIRKIPVYSDIMLLS